MMNMTWHDLGLTVVQEWANSDENKLPGPLGHKCVVRGVAEIKELLAKNTRVQTGGSCAMLKMEDTSLSLDLIVMGHSMSMPWELV